MTIDVQPFIDKLEVLYEYMCIKIDDNRVQFQINMGALPSWHNTNDIIKMYFETGWLFYNSNAEPKPTLTLVTFEEYYQQKNQSLNK